jgi:hypothetical protein
MGSFGTLIVKFCLLVIHLVKGATTGGVGGVRTPQLLLGPLQLFGQIFSWGVQSWWGPLFMIDNQFTYSYLTT